MPEETTLEKILASESLNETHLSPKVKENYDLESNVTYSPPPARLPAENYRSEGEREIAAYLEEKDIEFEYERRLVVESEEGKLHIRYPDFYLKDLEIIIEYNGSTGKEHEERYARKAELYEHNEVNYVTITSEDMKTGVWKDKIDNAVLEHSNQ